MKNVYRMYEECILHAHSVSPKSSGVLPKKRKYVHTMYEERMGNVWTMHTQCIKFTFSFPNKKNHTQCTQNLMYSQCMKNVWRMYYADVRLMYF